MYKFYAIFVFLVLPIVVMAQSSLSQQKCLTLNTHSGKQQLDTLTVLPASIVITPDRSYQFDATTGELVFEELELQYRLIMKQRYIMSNFFRIHYRIVYYAIERSDHVK